MHSDWRRLGLPGSHQPLENSGFTDNFYVLSRYAYLSMNRCPVAASRTVAPAGLPPGGPGLPAGLISGGSARFAPLAGALLPPYTGTSPS